MKRFVSLAVGGVLALVVCPWMANAAQNNPAGSGPGNGMKSGNASQSRMQTCIKQGKSREECAELMKNSASQTHPQNTNKTMKQNQMMSKPGPSDK